MLLWPLFVTSFVVDDFLGDHQLFGASQAVISSASAKTSIAAAFLLAGRPARRGGRPDLAGQPRLRRGASTATTGWSTYGEVASLTQADTCFIDVAGRADITHAVHTHFGARLRYSMVVGDTHWDHRSGSTGPPPGPKPTFLFAPDQITKRRREWGRDGFEQTVADSWNRFDPWTDSWLTLRYCHRSRRGGVGLPRAPRGTGRSPGRRRVHAARRRRLTAIGTGLHRLEEPTDGGTGSLGPPCPPRPTSALRPTNDQVTTTGWPGRRPGSAGVPRIHRRSPAAAHAQPRGGGRGLARSLPRGDTSARTPSRSPPGRASRPAHSSGTSTMSTI